jgi:hypothetical protein
VTVITQPAAGSITENAAGCRPNSRVAVVPFTLRNLEEDLKGTSGLAGDSPHARAR